MGLEGVEWRKCIPKLDLNPTVSIPSAGFSVPLYAPYALKLGFSVAPQVR